MLVVMGMMVGVTPAYPRPTPNPMARAITMTSATIIKMMAIMQINFRLCFWSATAWG